MIREIEFRGKCGANWWYGSLELGATDDDTFICPRNDTVAVPVQSATVGQWTGLLDANGVKIYEGDVVSLWTKDLAIVCFVAEDTAAYRVNRRAYSAPLQKHAEIEVVGNIHDTPSYLQIMGAPHA